MKKTLVGTKKETVFADVYERYADDIYRLCFSFLKNEMDAEDAVQETFFRFYHSEKPFDSEAHIKAWLIVTSSNYCKNLLKHWWRKRKDIDEYAEIIGKETKRDEMFELVMKLPEKYKTAVYLYYYEEYDSKQIAKMLNKPASTIRTYLQKARKMLKAELEE